MHTLFCGYADKPQAILGPNDKVAVVQATPQVEWSGHAEIMLEKVAMGKAIEEVTGIDLSAFQATDEAWNSDDWANRPATTYERKAEVTLTHGDIVNGMPGNVWIDPVGFAVKRAIPFSRRVRVSTVDIAFTISRPNGSTVEHERYIAVTPPEVAAWLERFDAKKSCRPITFTLVWEEEA